MTRPPQARQRQRSEPAIPTARPLAGRIRAWTAALVTAAGLLLSTGWPSPAAAHTQLASTTPAAGARLEAAPSQIRLVFTDRLVPQFNTAALSVGDGTAQTLSSTVDGTDLVVDVPTPAPAGGEWRVSYRVVASDGHPITGNLSFVVNDRAPTTSAPASATPARSTPAPATAATEPPTATPGPMFGRLVLLVAVLGLLAVPLAAATYASRPNPHTTGDDQHTPPDGPGHTDTGHTDTGHSDTGSGGPGSSADETDRSEPTQP